MSGTKDENDKLREGALPRDPLADAKPAPALRVVGPGEKGTAEPSDVAAEKALLGALLWCASNAPDSLRVSAVTDILPTGEPFYGRGHGAVFTAMNACQAEKTEHDTVAVAGALARVGKLQAFGGIEALEKLKGEASTTTESQARVYATTIRQHWAKRAAIRDLRILMQDALSPKVSDVEVFERSQQIAATMAERTAATAATISIEKSAQELFRDLADNGSVPMSTGYRDIDGATFGGLRRRETSIWAARTSVGKSTLAAKIAENVVTIDRKLGAMYVTMEMPHKSFTMKLLASRVLGISMADLRKRNLTIEQWRELTAQVQQIMGIELYFTVSMQQTLSSVFAAARERDRSLRAIGKSLGVVVVDHIGLVRPSAQILERKGSRQQQVAETSRGLRFIADQLDCHVMAICQIHRDADRQSEGKSFPKLHHLRESGDVEQDADQVWILHRPRLQTTGRFDPEMPAGLMLAKERMSDTSAETCMLLDYRAGAYADWNNNDESDFGTVYEGREETLAQRVSRINGSPTSPPPGFYEAGPPDVPADPQALRYSDAEWASRVVAAFSPALDGSTIAQLASTVGRQLGLSRRDLLRYLIAAVGQGRLRVQGSGDEATFWRVPA